MKVLLINNCFFRRGGSEAVFFGTADLLKEMGCEVVFFSMEDAQNIHTDSLEYFVGRGGKLTQMKDYFSNAKAAKKLEEILETEKPDIAHVHLFWGGISPSIFAVLKKHRVPLVHTVHDYRMVCPAYTFRNGRGEICEKCKGGKYIECIKGRCSKGSVVKSALMAMEMFYRNRKWHPAKKLDGIIYVSNFSKRKHEDVDSRFIGAKNTVLYNFTKIGEEYPMVEENAGYYLYYGRLSFEKGIETLLEVFARHPELTLKVVGTGPLEEELKNKYERSHTASSTTEDGASGSIAMGEKKCYENIQFLGYHSGGALAELVRSARYVCVPSEWYENNPMTIVEAYSMGVPVIGANIGGIPEIIEEGKTGFLFESGNFESLEKALSQGDAIDEREYSKMKNSCLVFAKEHFNSEIYKQKLIDFYKEVINDYR